jgi:hypothetical protein
VSTEKITVVMTSYLNGDFTLASLWALWRHYPEMRVVVVDGSTPRDFEPTLNRLLADERWRLLRVLCAPGACTEECRNAAVGLVETPLVLFMDNDCKVLGPGAVEALLEPFERYENCAQSGAYGLVVHSRKKRIGFVGTEFTEVMQLHASPCYFSLHDVEAYRVSDGMPKRFFYEPPAALWHDANGAPRWQPGWSGDFSITDSYHRLDRVCLSPSRRVPVLHWGQANRNLSKPRPVEDWWYENVKHYRLDPFDRAAIAAKIKEEHLNGNYESLFKELPRPRPKGNL